MHKKLELLVILFLCFVPLVYSLPYAPRLVLQRRCTNLRILPLGDSITWGWQPDHQKNGTDGYRAQLLSQLVAADYAVNFVGTQHSGTMSDNDNEGHPGYTINQIRAVMADGLAMKPNVVLLHAGTNDLNRPVTEQEASVDAPQRLGKLLDKVLKILPDTLVIVAKITQAKSTQTAKNIKSFNAAIPGVVKQRVEKGHKVILIDQGVIGADELVDGLHPTDAGYAHMGDIWFKGISAASEEQLLFKAL